MKTFTDNTGRTWTLSVTVGMIKRVRALCGVIFVLKPLLFFSSFLVFCEVKTLR